jgi:hypothetical protein
VTRTCFTLLLAFATLFAWADDYCLSAQTPDPHDDTLTLDAEVYLPSTAEPASWANGAERAPWQADPVCVGIVIAPSPTPPDRDFLEVRVVLTSAVPSLYALMSLQR